MNSDSQSNQRKRSRPRRRNRNGNRKPSGDAQSSSAPKPSHSRSIHSANRRLPEEVASFPEGNAFGALIPEIRQAVADAGYVTPSPIQAECIPHLLESRDLLGSAQTGTGKTAAFTLPLIHNLISNRTPNHAKTPRYLILAPTRELAAQIGQSIETYSKYLKLTHTVIFGGVGQRPQENAMARGVDFLVATPGRLLDLMNQGFIDLQGVEAFVLDEADRMLDMGFIHDVRKIIAKLPKKRHSLFFSATLAPNIIELANTLLENPVRVTIAPEEPTVDRIGQRVFFVDKGDKDSLLVDVIGDTQRVIVFTQMKYAANRVAEKLEKAGIPAAAIHGNKSQNARTRALEGFRSGEIRALVATDIAARGIDIDGVKLVVNYHLPTETETYVHRIGRTARAGADGDAVSFCSAPERDQLRDIEKAIKKAIAVERDHPFHSDTAENARGADAKPE
ncbi:MAG: DEAD/DEAH box helicase, partial [Verrucomicrobiota bacterium]